MFTLSDSKVSVEVHCIVWRTMQELSAQWMAPSNIIGQQCNSSINTLCSNSKTPFKGLALTILHMCDINEEEVSIKKTHIL